MFVSGFCGLASLPFHPQWSRFLQYVYASVCQPHAIGQCCIFPKSVLMAFPLFPCCSSSSKILPVFAENCIFELVQVFIQSPVSTTIYDTEVALILLQILLLQSVLTADWGSVPAGSYGSHVVSRSPSQTGQHLHTAVTPGLSAPITSLQTTTCKPHTHPHTISINNNASLSRYM